MGARTRRPGRAGLTFLRGAEAAASHTWGGSDSAHSGRRDSASQNSLRERAPVAEVSLGRKGPGLHFPEFPTGAGTRPAAPAAEVSLGRKAPGLHFPEFPDLPRAEVPAAMLRAWVVFLYIPAGNEFRNAAFVRQSAPEFAAFPCLSQPTVR